MQVCQTFTECFGWRQNYTILRTKSRIVIFPYGMIYDDIVVWINELVNDNWIINYFILYFMFVSDCCLMPTQANFQLYHGENKLIINERMMRSALYKTIPLSLIFIMLAHWNNRRRINMPPHSDTLSLFRANQSLDFLFIYACLAKKQHIPIL